MVFRKQALLLIVMVVFLVGSFLRLYRLPDTLQFLGDQGRDALRVARVFKQGDLLFIGPVTSIGNMYLGPLYYYFMVPWLWLTYPSPLGPAYAVAVISSLGIFLIYRWGSEMLGKKAALIATICFAFSSVVIVYSRFSWNPNLAPVFGLLLMWALYKAWTASLKYWLLAALAFSVLIQLHYLAMLSILPMAIVFLLQLRELRVQKKRLKQFVVTTLASLAIVGVFLSPLVLFDLKHQFTNLKAFQQLMGGQNSITTFKPQSNLSKVWTVIEESHGRSMQLLADMYFGQSRTRNTIFVIAIILLVVLPIRSQKKLTKAQIVVLLFVLTAIAGTSLYSHNLYDHYVLYVVPSIFLLFGMIGTFLWDRAWIFGKILVAVFVGVFVMVNVQRLEFQTASPSLQSLQSGADAIASSLSKEQLPYNVVLLSETKDYYGQNYRYFLDTIPGKEPLNPDHDDFSQAKTLVIINEEGISEEEISTLPIFEISSFSGVTEKQTIILPNGLQTYIWTK
ncbi:glycosyltransferase family 39 protein [Candidatus Woesebacteria bacterium]|nr:glycosyltransferase family 39 protein [Candidatus Woesebacteria bacterium]